MAGTGVRQVFRFVGAFAGTMVEALSPPRQSLLDRGLDEGAAAGGSGDSGAMTLALVQERVDIAAVMASLVPWMPTWRAQESETSVNLLEVWGIGRGRGCLAEASPCTHPPTHPLTPALLIALLR